MNEQELLLILQKYRHDVVNHIQLIHGYLTMDRPDRAKEKLDDWIELCEQERRLSSLRAPGFALWVIRFDSLYNRLRLEYHIHIGNMDLSAHDYEIRRLCEQILELILKSGPPEVLHEVTLSIEEEGDSIAFELSVTGPFNDLPTFKETLKKLETPFETETAVNEETARIRFLIPYQS